ncbi:MAG: DUF1698 domain-containing protein [Gemmatimonadaceae bacterium]|nr:DUF1698 domain-containing protein [Gemmatimonadaceae bacterium]
MPGAADVLRLHPEWYHSIELAPGVVTPGRAPLAFWEEELRAIALPDLSGRSVLDIGAYDGFFSFAAERRGAARVVALDHYAWFTDMPAYMQEWREAQQAGRFLPPPHLTGHWRPDELPGRRPFEAARAALGSTVEAVARDFMTTGPADIGTFDVVLFLGVLYHLEEPLTALRRVFALTAPGGRCVIETEAMEIPGSGRRALCEFFPGDELNGDASNWWAPNRAALVGLCQAAGFASVEVLPERQPLSLARRAGKLAKNRVARVPFSGVARRYRLVVHAMRAAQPG